MSLTRSQKLRMGIVATAVSVAAGMYGAFFLYAGSGDGGPVGGFFFTALCFVPAGLLLGWKAAQPPRRKPSPDDIETNWWREAQSKAFRDTIAAIAVAFTAVTWLPSPQGADVEPVLIGIAAFAGLDVALRYYLLRSKEQW